MNGLVEGNASSNSSVISSCSRKDIGNESTAGSSEGSNGGDDNPVSSQNDSCDDSESSVEDEHADQNRVFQDEELEPNTVVGVVLKSMNGHDSETVQNPVIRHVEFDVSSVRDKNLGWWIVFETVVAQKRHRKSAVRVSVILVADFRFSFSGTCSLVPSSWADKLAESKDLLGWHF
ncbi:hypothetical protein CRYUN_Cryun34aG0071900 [Craigia yunnanensis]